MYEYLIKKSKSDFDLNVTKLTDYWDEAKEIQLQYVWATQYPYQPYVKIKAVYTENFLYLYFYVEENAIRSTATKINDFVYIDSCIEFFCSPNIHKSDYYNLEMNCCGNVFMAYGPNRKERKFVDESVLKTIQYSSTVKGPTKEISHDDKNWAIVVKIPWQVYSSLSKNGKPKSGDIWKGNFYKCGDKLPQLHYGSWAKIDTPKPDFHQPDFFGILKFE